MAETFRNLVGGEWRASRSGKTFDNEDPARRGTILGHFQASVSEDVDEAIGCAATAFPAWRRAGVEERVLKAERFLSLLSARQEELARIVTSENGKTLREARAEIRSALAEGAYHARQVAAFFGNALPSAADGLTSYVQYAPLGVVGIISPWNFPVNVMCRKTLPALLTGNTVVFKPASFTPWSGLFMGRLFMEAGFPPGTFNAVTGAGAAVGDCLVADERIRAISFTGSTAVGKQIQQRAALRLTRTQLELGGKNALIVMDDADLPAALDAAVTAGFACAGQWCTSTSRILLHRAIHDRFVADLVRRCEAISVGDPLDEKTDMGPVAGPKQFDAICAAIVRAGSEGGKKLAGGPATGALAAQGCFIRPTVFTDVTPDMAIFRNEIFGPVVAVTAFDDFDQALVLANRPDYGLSSALFTGNLGAAMKYADRIEAGMAHVNIHTGFKIPALPFGGWKDSGYGPPENGRSGLEFFLAQKAVYIKAF